MRVRRGDDTDPKRLELTWTNKQKSLIASEHGYEWVSSDDPRADEIRLLTDDMYVDDNGDRDAVLRVAS